MRARGLVRASSLRRRGGALRVVIDVDGTMTDGRIYVNEHGKMFKAFGPDDHSAVNVARHQGLDVLLVSADKSLITQARAEHMSLDVQWWSEVSRIPLDVDPMRTVYVGDGYYDHVAMRECAFGIAVNDSWPRTRRAADAVTSRNGGHRAVAQALDFTRRFLCTS